MIWLIWFAGVLFGLDQLGLDSIVLVSFVIVIGIVSLVAMRNVLAEVASHMVVVTYRPYKIGDWIQLGKLFGRVVNMTWVDTVLMTPDSEMVYVPNSTITSSIIMNRSSPGGTRISVSMTVDRTAYIRSVEKSLLEVGAELAEELVPDYKPEVRVSAIGEHFIRLRLLLKVNNPAKGMFISSEVRKKALEKIDKNRGN
ncbi:mechanosensitive ion channel family protein [Candidatus Bathyarchaeota archaeon]|nr:mechanosensitive ion channel family protein [Candidatus Bathyarchaeota archaeon]